MPEGLSVDPQGKKGTFLSKSQPARTAWDLVDQLAIVSIIILVSSEESSFTNGIAR